jgi:hypothetical protein
VTGVVVEQVDERVVPDSGVTTVRAIVWATRLVALLTLATAVLPGPRRAFGGPLRSTLDLPATVGVTGEWPSSPRAEAQGFGGRPPELLRLLRR